MRSAEDALAEWASGSEPSTGDDPADLPQAVRAACLVGLSDSLGVAIGGLTAPPTLIARSTLSSLHEGAPNSAMRSSGSPMTRIWASEHTATPTDAAYLLGTAAHALDFDDYMHPLHGHVSAIVLPAAWAVAEPMGVTGVKLLEAYAVGYQVDWLASQALGTAHYERGWHATSTVGVLGAAAAVGRLRGLDVERMRTAMAIAASSAAGLRVNFGTHVKALHAGQAARAAVHAVQLAEAGASAAVDWLAGPHGMLAVMGGRVAPPEAAGAVDEAMGEWGVLSPVGLMLKPYPCCGSSHAAITAALAIREHLGDAPIDEVTVHVDPLVTGILRHSRPATPDEARYSLEYPVAAALLDGELTARQFTAERIASPDVQALLPRVRVTADRHNAEDERFAALVEVASGERIAREEVLFAPGHPRRPMSEAERRAKFLACAGDVLGPERAESVWGSVQAIEQIADVSAWPALLDPVPAPRPGAAASARR